MHPGYNVPWRRFTGASNADGPWWGRQKSRFSTNISLHRVLSTVPSPTVIHIVAPDGGNLVTLIAGKQRRLLFTGDDDEVFMTRSLNVTSKTTEHNLTVCSGKSEAKATTIKDCGRGTVLLTLATDRHETSRGLSAPAELLVLTYTHSLICLVAYLAPPRLFMTNIALCIHTL